MSESSAILIDICMGSSCFCRGNNRNVELIQTFISEGHCTNRFRLEGHLCQGKCKSGPNIVLGGKAFAEVDPVSLIGLLNGVAANREGKT